MNLAAACPPLEGSRRGRNKHAGSLFSGNESALPRARRAYLSILLLVPERCSAGTHGRVAAALVRPAGPSGGTKNRPRAAGRTATRANAAPREHYRLTHGSRAARADDNVKSGRQARPRAPCARHASGGHGNTADDGTCDLRTRLVSPALRVRSGVDGR